MIRLLRYKDVRKQYARDRPHYPHRKNKSTSKLTAVHSFRDHTVSRMNDIQSFIRHCMQTSTKIHISPNINTAFHGLKISILKFQNLQTLAARPWREHRKYLISECWLDCVGQGVLDRLSNFKMSNIYVYKCNELKINVFLFLCVYFKMFFYIMFLLILVSIKQKKNDVYVGSLE